MLDHQENSDMNNENIFLKYLIDEEIYLIQERMGDNQSDRFNQEDDKHKITGIYKEEIVLLLDYPDHDTIPGPDVEFLRKVLISVHVDHQEVKYLFQEEAMTLSIEDFDHCIIIVFLNAIPDNLSALFKSDRYVSNTYLNNRLLWIDPLDKIKNDKNLKRKLWNQLKILFEIPS